MKRVLVLLLCTSVMFLSCKDNQIGSVLSSAEISMNDKPEHSLEILESVDKYLLSTRKQKAKYALLYSIALDKNYIDIQSDSIIAPAVKYYECHGSSDDRIKTLYYYARVQYNAGDYNPAIVTLMKTLPLFETSSETRIFALIHNLFAIIYNDSFMFSDSRRHIDLAYEYALECADLTLADLILRRKGKYYSNIEEYDEAIKLYEQILNDNRIGEGKADVLCDYALSLILKDNPEYAKAVELYRQSLVIKPFFYDANHWGAYAYALNKIGEMEPSEQLFSQLLSMRSDRQIQSIYNSWQQMQYSDNKQYDKAYVLLSNMLPYQDSIFRCQFQNSAAKSQRDYLLLKNTEIEKDKRNRSVVLSLIIFILFMLSICLHQGYKRRLFRIQKEKELLFETTEVVRRQLATVEDERMAVESKLNAIIESRTDEITTLNSSIKDKDEKLQLLRSGYTRMYKSQFKILGELCEVYIRSNEYKDSHKMVYEKVKDMIKEINGDKAGHQRFEKEINKSLNNIMKHLRDDFPKYSESDYRFISYIIAGFDATTLSVIFDLPSQAAVYMKKLRIKKHILKSDSIYKELYLEMFD